jgi:hypothetical protein
MSRAGRRKFASAAGGDQDSRRSVSIAPAEGRDAGPTVPVRGGPHEVCEIVVLHLSVCIMASVHAWAHVDDTATLRVGGVPESSNDPPGLIGPIFDNRSRLQLERVSPTASQPDAPNCTPVPPFAARAKGRPSLPDQRPPRQTLCGVRGCTERTSCEAMRACCNHSRTHRARSRPRCRDNCRMGQQGRVTASIV